MTGMLFGDWFKGVMGSELALPDAVRVMNLVDGDAWVSSWLLSAKVIGLLFLPVALAGLNCAGVVGW